MRYVLVRVSLLIQDKTFKLFLMLILLQDFDNAPRNSLLSHEGFSCLIYSSSASLVFKLKFICKLLLNYRQFVFEITKKASYLSEPVSKNK
mgnify:CR=1 FL=1